MTIRFRLSWLPAVAVVVAAALVLPGASDAFEGPKRIVWCALALALAVAGLLRRDGRTGGARAAVAVGTALLVWTALRSFAVAPFWRVAEPLLAWTLPPLLLILAARIPWTEDSRRTVARTIVCIGIAEASLMVLQRVGLDPLLGAATEGIVYGPGRMVGTIGYQNQAAEFLGLAVCLVPAAWRNHRVRASAWILLCATIILTANRGAILSLAIVGVVAAISWIRATRQSGRTSARRILPGVVLVAGCAIGALSIVPELRARVGELAAPSRSPTIQSRAYMARVAIAIGRDNPVFGGGAGSFAYEYLDRLGDLLPERKEPAQIGVLVLAREAHCDLLQFAAEFGIVGGVLALVFLVLLVHTLRRAPCSESAMAGALFLCVCSLFSFSWQTSLAAPAAGLLLGMAAGSRNAGKPVAPAVVLGSQFGILLPGSAAVLATGFLLFVSLTVSPLAFNPEDSYWDAFDDDISFFVRGRRLADVAAEALRQKNPVLAAKLCRKSSTDWMSPDLLLLSARAFEAVGRGEDAVDIWLRLERSGLRHDEALRGLSRCLERLKRIREAASSEAERFRLWPAAFSDADVYRLCALKTMAGDAAFAERISRRFLERAKTHGEMDAKWTPEWANLRGGTLLSLGRFDEARAFFEDALRRNPGLESARRNLRNAEPGGEP